MRYARARQTGTQDCSTFIDPGREVKVFAVALVTHCARPVAVSHMASSIGSMAFYELLKML